MLWKFHEVALEHKGTTGYKSNLLTSRLHVSTKSPKQILQQQTGFEYPHL